MQTTYILAVDPGECTGWALGNTQYGPTNCDLGRGYPLGPHMALVELPEVRRGGQSRPADIITLALRAGGDIERLQHAPLGVFCIPPRTWKGTLKKAMHQPRIIDTARRKGHYPLVQQLQQTYGAKAHNGIDALGMLQWALDRIAMGGLNAFALYRHKF